MAGGSTVATTTIAVSAAKGSNEVSPWFSYSIDIGLLIAFLAIYFFVKPEKIQEEELLEEEKPNELEKILMRDQDPVEPKPPSPRSVSSKDSTSLK